jgi:pimeloyl-[acyl-carrier protein] synthase
MLPSQNGILEEVNDETMSLLRLFDPRVLADPHSLFRMLRESDPVHWDPFMHAWIVTSYQEVVTVITNYSADRAPRPEHLDKLGLGMMKPFSKMMMQQMLFMDPPMHTRLRSLCSVAFTPRKVEELRRTVEAVTNELIDNVIESGNLDILEDFAIPLPAIMTAKFMGLPVDDHKQLGVWVNDIAEVHGNFQHHPDRVAAIVKSLEEMKVYVADKMMEMCEHPNGGLISSLMAAEVDGKRLSDEEIIASTIVTIIGGHETTTNLIASGFLTLSRNPTSLDQLRSRPDIVGTAVEELLRYESPVQHTARIALEDSELGGKKIRKGDKVVAVLAAANRDPNRFPNPEQLDLTRTDNRHLAFGWASHFCFGAPLARMEGQIAFNTLLRRLESPVLLEDTLQWRSNAGLRGLTSLRVGFNAGKRKPETSELNQTQGQEA